MNTKTDTARQQAEAQLERRIVRHNETGESYIFEDAVIDGRTAYRAAGPVYYGDLPLTDDQMRDWLDNQEQDEASSDGNWLANAICIRDNLSIGS
jgi:hypothetical protein